MASTPGSTGGGGGGGSSGAAKRQRTERVWRGAGSDAPLRKYTPTPTGGTAPLHSSQDYGFADFYPSTGGRGEGVLDERAIRYGHVDVAVVANEYASGHEVVYERLQDARVFQELQAFAAGAAQRQRARGQITSTEVPALPNRAVRSDERREEWVRGLANARVPLSTLATSMPHGLRGERLLETLRAHWVPLQRAMWAIRMTGVYEMVALQTRAPDQASIKALEQQYTGQWSRQFTQFVEHTLAIAPTGTGSATTTPVVPAVEGASPAPAAASAGTPASWAQSWSFCLALLHAQYNQGLLDQRHMVSWLGTQLSQMAVDRCLLLLPVVRDYTAEIAKSRTPLRRLISAVVHRIDQAAKYRALQPMHVAFGEYLVELFTAHPDAFVEPSTWGPYRAALEHAVDTVHGDSERAALRRAIAQVDSRNAHFAGLVGGSDSAAPAPAARPLADADARLAPLRVLGALGPDSDLEKAFAELFETSTQAAAAHTLRLLCYWATEGPLPAAAARFRPLAAAHLCRLYLNHPGKAAGADGALHLRRMQGAIVGFLDILALPSDARRADTVRRVCVLLERLGDVGCFSISHYLELLTARGDFFGDNLRSLRSQRHLAYAAAVPANTPEDRRQYRMLMCDCGAGLAACPAAESLPACAEMRRGLCSQLPFLVAYACAEPLRAGARKKQPALDAHIVGWWLQAANMPDAHAVPAPAHLTATPLTAALAQDVCAKDWIAPVADGVADERALGGDISPALQALLRDSPRAATDFVVLRRLLPTVYDYVVKDVTVGVDNWRVITQPGSSLLNRRQAALVIRVLATADYPAQLLDLLLWLLGHTQAAPVAALAHCVLRGLAHTWALLGRIPDVVAAVAAALHGGAAGPDQFDAECYRTAHHCRAAFGAPADELWADATRAYDAHVAAHAPALLQGAHVPSQASAGKELAQLAQQLARERMRTGSGANPDDPSWAIVPCFQKLARWAAHATQRIGAAAVASSPAVLPDTPGSPAGGVPQQQALQSLFSHIVTEATRAALHSGHPLAPPDSPERLLDESVLRAQADVCAQLVRWVAQRAGLAAAPENTGMTILQALATAIGSWTLSWNSAPNSLGSSDAGSSRLSAAEIGVAVYASQAWTGFLLASGCLRVDELVPWLIGKCCEAATQKNAAQFVCLAGIICTLGAPVEPTAATADRAGAGPRYLHELVEIGGCWNEALRTNRVCRIQAVELVITSASAAGRLREIGASQIAVVLMHASAALAQSPWIQAIADIIPSSEADSQSRPSEYYTMLEIYRANIDAQIRDPAVPLPVKRAVLRALLALCEGVDPESEGFSAMTTAEVAHRLRRTVRRFWMGPAARGCASTDVSTLATILNALLLFASTALRESEATTEALAVAAGVGAIGGTRMPGASSVLDATTDLAACVQDAVVGWHADADGSCGGATMPERRCTALGEALATLPPDVLLQLVGCFAQTLFALCPSRLRAASDGASPPSDDGSQQQQRPTLLDCRASAVIDASQADAQELVELPLAETKDAADNEDDSPDSSEVARRGRALGTLVCKLLVSLGSSIDADSKDASFAPGEPLAAVRDFACGILGQLQCIAYQISPDAATRLALYSTRSMEPGTTAALPRATLDPARLRLAVAWRIQAVRPLCHLIRAFPDEFAVGEWLTTLVSLCLAPSVHEPSALADDGLFRDLLDVAAVVNESLTPPIRKHALALLRSAAPLLQSAAMSTDHAETLGRLFPFESSTTLTSDNAAAADTPGLDNPWMWIEALEFVPLAPLGPAAPTAAGLEGMTPFTLRGMLEHEAADRRGGDPDGMPTRLQYLNNPYFPMQPALLFPLAETPIPWAVFGAKRRRMDAETRLIWRSRCQAAFGP